MGATEGGRAGGDPAELWGPLLESCARPEGTHCHVFLQEGASLQGDLARQVSGWNPYACPSSGRRSCPLSWAPHDATTSQSGVLSVGVGSRPAAIWSWCHSCSARPLSTWATSASPARPSSVCPSASRRPGTLFTRSRGSSQACRKAVRSRSGTSVCMYWSNLEGASQGSWPGILLPVPSGSHTQGLGWPCSTLCEKAHSWTPRLDPTAGQGQGLRSCCSVFVKGSLCCPRATQRILGANDHPDDTRGFTCYSGQLPRQVFKGGTVSEGEQEEEGVCVLLASLGMDNSRQVTTWPQTHRTRIL